MEEIELQKGAAGIKAEVVACSSQQKIRFQELTSQEANIKKEVFYSLSTSGKLVITHVNELHNLSSQLVSSLEKYNWENQKSEISGNGITVRGGIATSYRNRYPLGNEILTKRILNFNEDYCPELLNTQANNVIPDALEQQLCDMCSNIFKLIIDCLEGDQEDNHKNTHEQIDLFGDTLKNIFHKSEIVKIRDTLLVHKERSFAAIPTPDFGLGSVYFLCKQKNELITQDQQQSDHNDENGAEVVVTCGQMLRELFSSKLKDQNHTNEEDSNLILLNVDTKDIVHQQIFYPNIQFHKAKINQISNKTKPQQQQEQQQQQQHGSKEHNSQKGVGLNKSLLVKGFMMSTGYLLKNNQNNNNGEFKWLKEIQDKMNVFQSEEFKSQMKENPVVSYQSITSNEFQLPSAHKAINCFQFNYIDSTMNIADFWRPYYMNHNNQEKSYAFIGDVQTQGQGQNKNTWTSIKGNCHVTFLFKLDSHLKYCLPHLAAISTIEALLGIMKKHFKNNIKSSKNTKQQEFQLQQLEKQLKVKWVNDVYLGDKKIAGMLCKVEQETIILGIGVNLNATPQGVPIPSISLKEHMQLNDEIDVIQFISKLWNKINKNISELISWDSTSVIFSKLQPKLLYLGQQVDIFDSSLQNILSSGIFIDINEYGNAILQTHKKREEVRNEIILITVIDGRMRPSSNLSII